VGRSDLCIYGRHLSGATITGIANDVDLVHGIAVVGKRHEFAIDQCTADMIKLGADLTEMSLTKGRIVDTVTIYGIAASYYLYKSKLLHLVVDF